MESMIAIMKQLNKFGDQSKSHSHSEMLILNQSVPFLATSLFPVPVTLPLFLADSGVEGNRYSEIISEKLANILQII